MRKQENIGEIVSQSRNRATRDISTKYWHKYIVSEEKYFKGDEINIDE
jgi:hypothetical protein